MNSANIIKRNNITIRGKGVDAMIFAHGFVGDQTLWRKVIEGFEDRFRIILFDYVGSGNSDMNAYDKQRYSSLEGYAQDIIEICRVLELKNVVFVGHSISGIIGLIAAIRGVNFSSIIMVAPSPRYVNEMNYHGGFEIAEVEKMLDKIDNDYVSWAEELVPAVLNNPKSTELVNEVLNKLLHADREVLMNFARATFFADYRKELLKLRVPSLILQCQSDIMVPLEVGNYLHAHLDNSTLIRLKAKGHFPHLSAPTEVIEAIKHFLGVA